MAVKKKSEGASGKTVTLKSEFKYAINGLHVVNFLPGKYCITKEYQAGEAGTIGQEIVNLIPSGNKS